MRSLDDLLASSPWARELEPEQLQRVRTTTLVRDYPAGACVCHKGDLSSVWIGVVDGLVKLTSLSQAGKSVTFTGAPTGSWFGEGSVLKREPRKYDVIALRLSRVALVPDTTFFWLLDSSIPFNRFLLTQLNERLGQFMGAFEHDRLAEPHVRVARSLAILCHPQLYPGTARHIEMSQEELGNFVGASRQTVSQALQVLEKAGLIKVEYRQITIVDLDGLHAFGG